MPGALRPQNPKLANIPDVDISGAGRLKYIMCTVTDPDKPEDKKVIVRGSRAEFHADIYDELDSQLEQDGVTCCCIGGGMITVDTQAKTIEVFGKSQGYGTANHLETVSLLRVKYPDYDFRWT